MQRQLLVQSCSETKVDTKTAVPALERYDGYFYKIIKKAIDEGQFDSAIDICCLSAEHGLIDADEPIEPYDRRMDEERAAALRSDVVESLRAKISDGEYEQVIVNTGAVYRRALEGFATDLSVDVVHLDGGGIGQKGHQLKQIVRTDCPSSTAIQHGD